MSVQLKDKIIKEEENYLHKARYPSASEEQKVNLNDLVNRLHLEKKKERKHSLMLSVAAVSAVTVFGIILTL